MPTKIEKDKKDREKRCGQLLVDFVNAKTPEDARLGLMRAVRKEFGFDVFLGPLKSQKRPLEEDQRKEVDKNQSDLRKLLSEIEEGKNVCENEFLNTYLLCYDMCCKPVAMDEEGHIQESQDLGDESEYDQVLAYCLITFLENEDLRQYIHKCQYDECPKFFMSKKTGDNKFCDEACKTDYHNKEKKRLKLLAEKEREQTKQYPMAPND